MFKIYLYTDITYPAPMLYQLSPSAENLIYIICSDHFAAWHHT